MIPNYAERRRYGERASTGFVESTVNTVLGKRQQMRWSKQGRPRWGIFESIKHGPYESQNT